jgi:protein-L-isoaspartate(D-aspartate) O-methyltransferase
MKRAWLLPTILGWPACAEKPHDEPSFAAAREKMVREQIIARGIADLRVLDAMRAIARHELVPAENRQHAYEDRPLPIGHGQTISQPFIVAFMTEHLAPGAKDRVLEIGTGSGYQAAILSRLVREVFTIEIIEPLATRARADLGRIGCRNVHVRHGDGYQGWPEKAPFDSIIVTCAPENIPSALVAQLREGGRMVIPVGGVFGPQTLYVLEKREGIMEKKTELPVAFVPMVRPPR